MLKYTSLLLVVVSLLSPQEALVEKGANLQFFPGDSEGTSYAEFDPWSWRPNASLQFFFQTNATREEQPLVFYQDDGNYQFMDLFLLEGSGHARFRARVGKEKEAKQRIIEQNFVDSKWHRVKIEWTAKEIRFSIEDENGRLHTRELPIEMNKYTKSGTSSGLFMVAGIPLGGRTFSHPPLFNEVYLSGKSPPNLFEGCIGDIRVYRPSNGRLERARRRKPVNAKGPCPGACVKHSCSNGGRCIDKIWKSECDCSGTGHEGERCTIPSIAARFNVPKRIGNGEGGYISQLLSDDSRYLRTERNTLDFMFLTEAKDGVIFYMGREKDHLLAELVNGSLRVEADVGAGPFDELAGNNALADSCWHYVKIRRRKKQLTIVIDREEPEKVSQNCEKPFYELNLDNQSNTIYYGGGPPEVLRSAQAKPLSFKGFLKQFHFEEFNVLKHALVNKTAGFSVSDEVSKVWSRNYLLHIAEKKCSRAREGSGCSPSDDDSDSCKPLTTPTEGTAKSTAAATTTLGRITTQPQPQATVGRLDQKPTPRPKGVSAWVIIVIVLAAMALVFISVFLLYRWNHRYTGSFKPNKNEEGQAQEPGADPEQQQSSRVHNQPAFFVYKPPKKATTAQSPPVSI